MISFKFGQNLKPVRDNKEKKSNKKLENKDTYLKNILDKHPSAFSIEEILESELPNGSEDEKRDLENDLLNFLTKISEEEQKKREDSYIRMLQNREQDTFNEIKQLLTKDFVEKIKTSYDPSYLRTKNNLSYFVVIAVNDLAKIYFEKLNKKRPTKKEYEKIKELFKNYYYNKNKDTNEVSISIEQKDTKYDINKNKYARPNNTPELRNFYEVEKKEDNPEE